jgi:hypothetical protein
MGDKMDIAALTKITLENLEALGLVDDVTSSYDTLMAGFTGLPEGILENFDETNIVGMILATIGHGETDFDDGTFTPSQDKIYCFDVEVFPMERMYARFIDGIASIAGDDVQFANVTEDMSGVDWEAGTGTWILSFECNGKPYVFSAKMNGDWFDTGVIAFMNTIFKEQEVKGRLWATSDGMQECILFYNDENWAKEYERIMGYELQ